MRVCAPSHLSFGHEVCCDGHVLEEDGEVQSAVTFSVGDGGVSAIAQQLDDGGQVTLPVKGEGTGRILLSFTVNKHKGKARRAKMNLGKQ